MLRRLIPFVVLIAIAARAWLHWSTPLVQGMNGGYYLVQARSLIEKFALAIPDLPLVFVIQACFAKLVHWCSSLSLNESVLFAVKSVDSVLPAFSVIPVMLLGCQWSKGDKVDLGIIALAAVLVPAGAPALLMIGDFEKNSLGLALLCTLVWALHRWASEPTRPRLAVAVGLLGLIGVTHIGVFGTTLIFVGSALVALAVAHGREGIMKVAKLALIAAPVVILAASLVFWKFDPSRIHKLIHAFSEPSDYLSSGGGPPGMKGGPMRGPTMLNMMGGPPGMGAPSWMQYAPMAAFALAAIPALLIVWWRRATIGIANVAVISGAAITVILLTGPWVSGDKVMRFQLNAVPLAILCLLFALLQVPHRWARGVPGVLLLIAALFPSWTKLREGARPIISVQAQAELQRIAKSVESPERTLVVAHHGLEWWTAWTLHTHISQAQALTPKDWKKYKYVWFIEENRVSGMMPFGPGMMGPGGRGGPGPRGGGMMGAPIPENAEILHNGEFFRLAWVREVPEFVLKTEPNPLDIFGDWPLPN